MPISIIFKAAWLFFYKITTHFTTLPPTLHQFLKSALKKWCFVFETIFSLQTSPLQPPYPASYCTHINTLIINGLHSSVNFNWRNFFRGWELNNSTLFEPNVWKLFHFDVHWVRTISICVFKVKYDGREIPCDYSEPVLSRYVYCK